MDAVFDRVLLVHALEESERRASDAARGLARDGAGRALVVIAANRWSLWAQSDATPFGYGRPYSRTQLAALLGDSMFEPVVSARALYAPPWRWTPLMRAADAFERVGEMVWPRAGRACADGSGEAPLCHDSAFRGACPFGQSAAAKTSRDEWRLPEQQARLARLGLTYEADVA